MTLSGLLRQPRTLVAVALATAGVSSQAATVFDSLSGIQGFFSQCLVCGGGNPTIGELGDIITLGGTERVVQSVSMGLSQQTLTSITGYTANLTFSIYSIDTTTLATTLLGSAMSVVPVLSTGPVSASFSFNNLAVPGTIYYGISASSTAPDIAGLQVSLWDYWSVGNGGDGQTLPVGIDPGTVINGGSNVDTVVYGRLASDLSQVIASTSNGLGVNNLHLGFTPSLQISAVPEPETYGLMALGLVAMGAYIRRRKQAA
jgi:hypothetical protein